MKPLRLAAASLSLLGVSLLSPRTTSAFITRADPTLAVHVTDCIAQEGMGQTMAIRKGVAGRLLSQLDVGFEGRQGGDRERDEAVLDRGEEAGDRE
jgi:hypothetical protein